MNWIFVAVAAAALLCPVMMWGPMLLGRLGIGKRRGAMSCMPDHSASPDQAPLRHLRQEREKVERQIAELQAQISTSESPHEHVPAD